MLMLFPLSLFMGQYRSTPSTQKYHLEGKNQRLTYCATAMCGWRTYMEDAHIAIPQLTNGCSLFGVFDGHGGGQVAQYVSEVFAKKLTANKEFANKNYQQSIIQTYRLIDQKLKSPSVKEYLKSIKQARKKTTEQKEEEEEQEYDVGSTAVVCLITESHVYVANIGDSRCMAYIDGKCIDLSYDHKPQNQVQLNRIILAGGQVIEGRVNGDINLSRAFGDFSFKSNTDLPQSEQQIICQPDIKVIPLQNISYLILGCDGIFQKKSNKQISNLVATKAQQKSLSQVNAQIMDMILSPNAQLMRGKDNMTLIVIKFNN